MHKADDLPQYYAVIKKSRNLNFLETSGSAWPVTGVLYLYLYPLGAFLIRKYSNYKCYCDLLHEECVICNNLCKAVRRINDNFQVNGDVVPVRLRSNGLYDSFLRLTVISYGCLSHHCASTLIILLQDAHNTRS